MFFCCSELLDKIQAELRPVSSLSISNNNSSDQTRSNSISKAEPHERCEVSALTTHSDIVDSIFQGELVSEVRAINLCIGTHSCRVVKIISFKSNF